MRRGRGQAMKFERIILLLAGCLWIMVSPAVACDVSSAAVAIASVSQKIQAGQIKRIDLLKISDRLLAGIPPPAPESPDADGRPGRRTPAPR